MSVQNDLFGSEVETKGDLFDRFGVPPFSVLDTRQGYWQTGKKQLINKYHLESNNSRIDKTYGNLEKYSNLKGDISNMDYSDFILSYQEIIQKTLENLNNNSFSCFVVSNFRNKKGNYNGFVRDTQYIFEDSGCNLYNEFILLNSVGTVRLRVGKQFDATRKCGGVHQNILVFLKGDAKKATEKIKNANKNI